MAKTIKSILMEANRYRDVLDIILRIINSTQISYPVHAFAGKDGQVKHYVNGDSVREEARNLYNIIYKDGCAGTNDDFTNLSEYVKSHSDDLLHNYAVAVSHRIESDINMEDVRSWEILDNLLMCWNIGGEDDEDEWYIPDGWKRITTSESKPKQENNFDIDKLISTFEDMANRGTLLTGANVTQEDLLMQIIGTIVKVSREDK